MPVIEGLPDLASVLEAWGLAGVPELPLEHDGWSGALLTQLTRPDGARFVLKRDSVGRDWIARVTDDELLREAQFVHANPLLPPPVGLPHLAIATDGDEIAELMPIWLRVLVGDERAGQLAAPAEKPARDGP